jgi:hypothetical protein
MQNEEQLRELHGRQNRALRLTFEYEDSNVRLISRQSVEMVVPPSDAIQNYEGQKGFWYELRDEKDHTLYRRVIHNPIKFDVEVFYDDPENPITRREVKQPRGTFFLAIPDLEQAVTLTLHSSQLESKTALQSAQEIARFDLKPGS